MIIGIDFDNTIADYTGVFYRVGCALGWLPESVGQSKNEVKQYFIDQYNEARWTELQGIVYGKEITQARPYPGALDAMQRLHAQGHKLAIVSHKTKYPIIGERVDFHNAATQWLLSHGFIGSADAPVDSDLVFFNETKVQKVARISQLKCDVFIDDLPDILTHSDFPEQCHGVLFAPNALQGFSGPQINHWQTLDAWLCSLLN
ncbi:HAD family hydrolase [Pseudoalteromonas sp. DL2-H2.2]|uniref:HAD family hydrolase n=1 Tax=Pseudoalteromonas sp. DL2-H2.2 TaxID=2908889 RepID=UPI001F1E610A|nr:HAD family hydrolase [Pseudoalteromonas sp. DL2-H2.2]MCF2909729.1 HAD family hydrolase [Pseudoalteromonas sp. DL2-H2.2]